MCRVAFLVSDLISTTNYRDSGNATQDAQGQQESSQGEQCQCGETLGAEWGEGEVVVGQLEPRVHQVDIDEHRQGEYQAKQTNQLGGQNKKRCFEQIMHNFD